MQSPKGLKAHDVSVQNGAQGRNNPDSHEV